MTTLTLGTAQWGTPYGITNTVGRLSDETIADIVSVAHEWDVTRIDTACGYGDAQTRLAPVARDFLITTKVAGVGDVPAQLLTALRELSIDSVDSVLVHDWDALSDEQRLTTVRSLGRAVDAGQVRRVGVSVYDEPGVSSAIDVFASRGCSLGALQIPANVLDRRLDDSTVLSDLAATGADIVVRSAFLQGLLVTEGGGRADHPDVVAFRTRAREQDVTPVAACLAHARALTWATQVVVGVTSAHELSEICEAWASVPPTLADADLASTDPDLIDPRRW